MKLQMTALGAQLRWGADLSLRPADNGEERLLVCGMGGSGIVGDFLATVAAAEGGLAMVHKGFGLPGWAVRLRPSVVAISYSGNTAETISSWEAAHEHGLPVTVITSGGKLAERAALQGDRLILIPGGYQPRSALGFGLSTLMMVASQAGLIADSRPSLEEAAGIADVLSGAKREGAALASELAAATADRMVGVYGSTPLTAVAAYRWKTQVNENAKRAAFWGTLPEVTHNEIVGWTYPLGLAGRRVGVVSLRDHSEHHDVSRQFTALEGLISDQVSWVGEVWSVGDSPLARLISLVAMGDLFSLELARQSGADPMRVELIDRLKEQMTPAGDPADPRAF